MLSNFGSTFADRFRKYLPDSFIFAILLTFVATILAVILVDASLSHVVQSWYKGFGNYLNSPCK